MEANTDDSNVVGDEKIYRALTRWLQATLPINPSSALNVAETKLCFTLRGGDGIHARAEHCSVRIKLRLKPSRQEAEEQVRNV